MKLSDLTIDTDRAESGVWWSYATWQPCVGNVPHPDQFCVQARARGDAFKNALRDALSRFSPSALRGKQVDEGLRKDIATTIAKVWADHIVVAWANLDGVPFSHGKAVEFMAEPRYRLIREFVEHIADANWAYLADAEEDAKGN